MNVSKPKLFLASQSPRRRALLDQIGVAYDVLDIEIEERVAEGEPPLDYVRRVAREKAGAGLLRVVTVPNALVLAADTEVVLDDSVFGKPVDAGDAAAMLRRLSGRSHQVLSAVAVISSGRELEQVCVTEVRFGLMSERDIADYIATGECFGKAGAYAIQGYAARYIERVEGSYTGVMGLPLYETARLLNDFNA